ncbi:uncharacterized protein BJ212DRAFT_1321228, partial [Suillus subaureus]
MLNITWSLRSRAHAQVPPVARLLNDKGAFEKLFNTVIHEGGLEGGVISHLLRCNSSNQSYFRKTSLPALLYSLLLLL